MSLARPTWHDCAYHDRNEYTQQDEEETNVCEFRKCAVGEHDDCAGDPGDDEVDDEDGAAAPGSRRGIER